MAVDDVDLAISSTSHEFFELLTDPQGSTWYGSGGLSDEIGDKCNRAVLQSPNRYQDGGDVRLGGPNGHDYLIQQEWSNAATGCVLPQGLPTVSNVAPGFGPDSASLCSTTAPPTVTITGAGLGLEAANQAPLRVMFGTVPASSVIPANLDRIFAIVPPQPPGTVSVTVTTSEGTSSLSGVFTYQADTAGPITTAAVSPALSPSGFYRSAPTVTLTASDLTLQQIDPSCTGVGEDRNRH